MHLFYKRHLYNLIIHCDTANVQVYRLGVGCISMLGWDMGT